MEVQNYLKEIKLFHQSLLNFLDDDSEYEENYSKLIQIIQNQKILENEHKLKEVLHLTSKLVNNHNRTPMFNTKIERLLSHLKDSIKKHLTNEEILKMFIGNKRVLLFLIEQQIIQVDVKVAGQIRSYDYYSHYDEYFYHEIKQFLRERDSKRIEENIQKYENYEELRKIGQNHQKIAQLIRDDLQDEFIIFVNKNEVDVLSNLDSSIFETNPFLLHKYPSLIEYAAFNGSIRIFNYLLLKNAKLTPSLWLYAIHANNAEIIQILQDNGIKPPLDKKLDHTKDTSDKYKDNNNEEEEEKDTISYDLCLKTAVECHHNQIVNFLFDNFPNQISLDISKLVFENFNFEFIKNSDICKENFFLFCTYDYYLFVEALLSENEIDVNELTISKKNFNDILKSYFF